MKPLRAKVTSFHYWAAKSDTTSRLTGRRVTLHLHWWKSPKHEHGRAFMLFDTRRACRAWIEEHYGYLRGRPDLLAEPHGWRVPVPVKVTVVVTEIIK